MKSVLNNSDAHASAYIKDGELEISYDLDPWMLTASTGRTLFLNFAKDLVPRSMALYPQISMVEIHGRAAYTDNRGHTGRDDYLDLSYSRANAKNINWSGISTDDVARQSDRCTGSGCFPMPSQ